MLRALVVVPSGVVAEGDVGGLLESQARAGVLGVHVGGQGGEVVGVGNLVAALGAVVGQAADVDGRGVGMVGERQGDTAKGEDAAHVGRVLRVLGDVQVHVERPVAGGRGRAGAAEDVAVDGRQPDVADVVVGAADGEARVAAVARPVKTEGIVAHERQLPLVLQVGQAHAVVQFDREARGARGVLDGRRLRAAAGAELVARRREGEHPAVRIALGLRRYECVGHGLVHRHGLLPRRQCRYRQQGGCNGFDCSVFHRPVLLYFFGIAVTGNCKLLGIL